MLGIKPVAVGRDLAEQVQSISCMPGLVQREFLRAVAKAPRFLEPTQPQISATQRVVGQTQIANDRPK